MNSALQERWWVGHAPFGGLTIASDGGMPLGAVRAILAEVVPYLQRQWDHRQLYLLEDWHAHDGYLRDARATSWGELRVACSSNAELLSLCSDDTGVATAVYPDDYGFLPSVRVC
jgi:hypothetical protein